MRDTSSQRLLYLTIGIFLVYLTVGAPLPVIPRFVHETLGYSPLVVGLVIGAQAAATLLARTFAGALSDRRGPKFCALAGAVICIVVGLIYAAAVALSGNRSLSLTVLVLGRLVLGVGDSLFITGAMSWSVHITGPQRAGKGLVWVGAALYGATALGAPLGVQAAQDHGFATVAIAVAVLAALGGLLVARLPAPPVIAGTRMPLAHVIGRIWKPGLGLAMSGIGFAVIAAFVTLFYEERGWQNAAYALTAFGVAFIVARIFFGSLPDRLGGARVALASLAVEIAGQGLLWTAASPIMAMAGAALTGFGYSLTFPALGVEAVRRVPQQSRGAALGAYVVCLDLALALGPPVASLLVQPFGYAATYLLGAGCAALAALIATSLLREDEAGGAAPRAYSERAES